MHLKGWQDVGPRERCALATRFLLVALQSPSFTRILDITRDQDFPIDYHLFLCSNRMAEGVSLRRWLWAPWSQAAIGLELAGYMGRDASLHKDLIQDLWKRHETPLNPTTCVQQGTKSSQEGLLDEFEEDAENALTLGSIAVTESIAQSRWLSTSIASVM